MKDFSQLCKPAKIYFAIAVVATIFALFNDIPVMMVVVKLLFAFMWTFVLGFLCEKGYTAISWFLVCLPYIIIALAMVNIHINKNLMKSVHLQDAYGQ